MTIKKGLYFICFQFLSVFALCANNTLVLKYGQDLDSIVSYNGQGEAVSKFRYFFDSDKLSSATIDSDKGRYNYQYTYTQDNYLEDIIFSEKLSSEIFENKTRKTISQNTNQHTEYNYIWKNNSWEKAHGVVATYTNNLLSQVEDVKGVDNEWIVTKQMKYSYYNSSESVPFAGKLKEVYSFADGKKESAKIEYRYTLIRNEVCLQSETVYAINDAGVSQKCMSTEYSYPSNNQEIVLSNTSYFEPETQNLIGKEKHTLSRKPETLDMHRFEVFDASNKLTESRESMYFYKNNNLVAEEKISIAKFPNTTGIHTQQTRFSTNLSEDKPVSVTQEFLSDDQWLKKEELLFTYDTESNSLRKKELKKHTELTRNPVWVYVTEWRYKPGAGIDSYTTYYHDAATSDFKKAWSFSVFYPGDGSTDPEGLKKIESDKKSQISIYPNPASENIFISGENQESDFPIQYVIYNLAGKLQKKGIIYTPQDGISVTMLATGNYVLRLTKDGQHSSCVFVKQ